MAFAIAATRASDPVTILGASSVDVSYPGFFETLDQLTHDL
jgi:5-enolpyruvylshikimate-3-phosphate synthase